MYSDIGDYGGTETLLIVDDDKQVLNLLSDFFCDNGYNVITARDGEEAVDIYLKNFDKIHLVLMDIAMPRKDGIAASIEMTGYNANAIICFMSGYSPDACNELVERNFIKKPFLPSEVIKMVRERLDSHS